MYDGVVSEMTAYCERSQIIEDIVRSCYRQLDLSYCHSGQLLKAFLFSQWVNIEYLTPLEIF